MLAKLNLRTILKLGSNTQVRVLQDQVDMLQAQVKALAYDPAYGCLTSSGLALKWEELKGQVSFLVYCDIDYMHLANEQYTHKGVDAKIRMVISSCRSTDAVAARIYSGDELGFLIKEGDPVKLAERLQALFLSMGLSATWAIVKVDSQVFSVALDKAIEMVEAAKKENWRGSINGGNHE